MIEELINDLTSFNVNDILVHVHRDDMTAASIQDGRIQLAMTTGLKKKYNQSLLHFRETGVHLLCLTKGILKWNYRDRECFTPILLVPLQYTYDKVRQELQAEWEEGEWFVNPFLVRHFQQQFDYTWPSPSSILENFNALEENLHQRGFNVQVQDEEWVGNFHHHRLEVLRDLEILQLAEISDNLTELIHYGSTKHYEKFNLSGRLLFAADNDQLRVFNEITDKNIVVQGPPGTGKSQVLGNMIGKAIFNGYSTLVVSEKRAALEVLKNRLGEVKLGDLAFLPVENTGSKELIQQLKANWQSMEKMEPTRSHFIELSPQLLDSLQLKLDILMREDLIGGISYSEYTELVGDKNIKESVYNGNTATIVEFLNKKPLLDRLYQEDIGEIIRFIPQALLEESRFLSLEMNIRQLEKKWQYLRSLFEFDTKDELANLMKKASFAQMISNELHQPYFRTINPTKAEFNRFARLYRKYLKLKKDLEAYEDQINNWNQKPSKEEAMGLLERLDETGFLKKFRLQKKLNQLLRSSFIQPRIALNKWIEYCLLNEKKNDVESQLLSIGIQNERDMEWVSSLQLKILKDDWKDWRATSVYDNNILANNNADLHIFYQNVRTYITIAGNESLSAFFEAFHTKFADLVKHRRDLIELTEPLYKQLGQLKNLDDLENSILRSNWVKFIGQFNFFEQFQMKSLHLDIQEIIQMQNKECIEFAEKILFRVYQKWDQYQKLLLIGTKKLKKEQRLLKERLKKGKSILIKEFGKTRSHPTIRELLDSEAREWIEVLIPVWMLNPAQVANFFPMETKRFDFLLFDESTQIPLSNAIGAIQRSRRVLVVGDEQQMTPSNFFKSGDSEPLDLLHQAGFTWKKMMLRHHYRSQNPELISFSNKHFYDHQLVAYPSPGSQKSAIHLHFLPEGTYDNRRNEAEAKQLAEEIRNQLANHDEKIGIVAFSESQLACIEEQFSPAEKTIIEQRIEDNSFFLKALENVQGDECDLLYISLGYGKNAEGKVLLNFGPLNRKSGRRRLNVLFTRARKNIHFYASIQASDLIISQNEALNLLRLFLQQLEDPENQEISFPYNLEAEIENHSQIRFPRIFKKIKDANELVTLQRVLENRNWQVLYA